MHRSRPRKASIYGGPYLHVARGKLLPIYPGKDVHSRPLMMKTFFISLFLAFICAANAVAADHPDRNMTADQARALVLASLTPGQKRLPSLGAEPYKDPNTSKFLFFTVTWAGTPNGSVVVGNYAVDPRTGDVFNATAACDEETNTTLRNLQTRIRANLHLSRSEYRRLKTKGPLCED